MPISYQLLTTATTRQTLVNAQSTRVLNLESAGTALCFPDLNAVDDCDSLYLDEDTWAREVADRD